MKWFLSLLILVSSAVSLLPGATSMTTYASLMPNMPMQGYVATPQIYPQYRPYSLNYVPQAYGYQPMNSYSPYGFNPYVQSAYNSYGAYGQPSYFGQSAYYGRPAYYPQGFAGGYPQYGFQQPAFAQQQPGLLNSIGPLLQNLLMGQNNIVAPVAPPAPPPTYAANQYYPSTYSSYEDHSQYCETCHISRRQPIASRIATNNSPPSSYVNSDFATEARYGNANLAQPPVTPQSEFDRVAMPGTVDDDEDDDHDHDHGHDHDHEKPVTTVVSKAPPAPAAKSTPPPAPPKKVQVPNNENLATPSQKTILHPRSKQEEAAQTQPVWEAFADEWRACAPAGCEPYNYASQRNDSGKSCHTSGRAIDVHAMVCPTQQNGKTVMSTDYAINSRKFAEVVRCVQNRARIKVLWHNKPYSEATKTTGHYDHAHFSIKCYGGTYW